MKVPGGFSNQLKHSQWILQSTCSFIYQCSRQRTYFFVHSIITSYNVKKVPKELNQYLSSLTLHPEIKMKECFHEMELRHISTEIPSSNLVNV